MVRKPEKGGTYPRRALPPDPVLAPARPPPRGDRVDERAPIEAIDERAGFCRARDEGRLVAIGLHSPVVSVKPGAPTRQPDACGSATGRQRPRKAGLVA